MWTHWKGNILDALFDCFLEKLLFLRDHKNFHQIPVLSKHDTRRAGGNRAQRTMTEEDVSHQVLWTATNLRNDSVKTSRTNLITRHTERSLKQCLGEAAAPTVYFFLPSSLEGHKNCEYAVDKPKFPGAAAVWADTGVHVRCCCSSSSSSFINQG